MNGKKILEMVSPSVKDNQLTYEKFDEIFCMLSQQEKYSVAKFVEDELKISLVDEALSLSTKKFYPRRLERRKKNFRSSPMILFRAKVMK